MFSLNKISFGILSDTDKYAQSKLDDEYKEYSKLNLNDIIKVDFPDNQYYREQTTKKQIVLHHTVSGKGVMGDIEWWKGTPERIATSIIIQYDGKIYQCFSSLYWAHHLGLKTSNNVILNKASIGVEIDSWGPLMKYQNKWYPIIWSNSLKKEIPNIKQKPIDDNNVIIYPNGFNGYYAFEKYTNNQIDSLRKLLIYWGDRYNIPLDYNDDMWSVSERALSGVSGIWTHVSYRSDKSDCHPQPELIEMLKSLK